jgi:hypothetical protein
LEGYEKIYIEE